LNDAIIMLSYAHEVDLSKFIVSDCKKDLIKLKELIDAYLNVTKISNSIDKHTED
ncbi:unnamed protein product, partial [marine sediment metagenome]